MKKLGITLLGGVVVLAGLAALVWHLNVRDEPDVSAPMTAASAGAPAAATVARGEYLARAGDCMACHTARGGAAFAGGLGLPTPFGTVYTSNLTPDNETGIGSWSSAYFWRALHNGRAKDGRLLYPAFPYTNYTQVTREDSDAIYAWLRTLAPVHQANRPHALRWPYSTQAALAVWRALFFKPGAYVSDPTRTAEWNRGAYLVQGLGHCSACHATRNALGATSSSLDLAGGLIPLQNWYAPSLESPLEAGVADWDIPHIVELFKTGATRHGWVTGPMAEAVLRGTQYLSQEDLVAMAQYLKNLPAGHADVLPAARAHTPINPAVALLGARLYKDNCAQCHGDAGQGVPHAYPTLAGNRAVTMDSPANLVQMVLYGGFPPATGGNPRPFGMPPYVLVLSDADIAAVLTHIRTSWGNQAEQVTEVEVNRLRSNATP
ncbi:c-type cytochrome [Rhodoferax sediminis]|uniref:C-type cytochrome n=1 Tax=Rhodoferax sediminis TaxID=2509614 RepID=A0A515DCY8_9BURK|nr:cytochrome c [Rhodoferax sediminis]QDL38276.1 c-type cytochrome [Rhodoferax sediminis]